MFNDFTHTMVNTEQGLAEVIQKYTSQPRCGLDSESSGPNLIKNVNKSNEGAGRPSLPGVDMSQKRGFLNVFTSTLTGISVAFPDRTAYYVPLCHERNSLPPVHHQRLFDALSSPGGTVYVHNLKHEMHSMHETCWPYAEGSIDWCGKVCTLVWMWLIRRAGGDEHSPYGLKSLARSLYGHKMKTFQETTKGRQIREIPPKYVTEYACEDAIGALLLGEEYYEDDRWVYPEAKAVYWNNEKQLTGKIYEMERAGIAIDREFVRSFNEKLEGIIQDSWSKWRAISRASISSDKGLQKLYSDRIWTTVGVDKTKTGLWSTNRDAMEIQLASASGEGRRLAEIKRRHDAAYKLWSTYTRSLVQMADQYPDGRLHPSFNQTGTETGRFSSNLQNLPARSELGAEVRKCFVPAEGKVFVGCDYSQIELRVAAHFCGSGLWFDAFHADKDLYQAAADAIGLTRDQAKTFVLAELYGAGASKLAAKSGMSLKEAYTKLSAQKKAHPQLEALREKVVGLARSRGFVYTLDRRIRRFPNINSGDGYLRSKSEREAFNTPIQGSARDVIVRAQIVLPHTLLQIHDELVWEVRQDEASEFTAQVVAGMEHAWPEAKVPIKVTSAIGTNLGELK